MSRRPRGALPGWEPRTPRQTGILADLVARYEQHHEEDTLPREERDERERLSDAIRDALREGE
jgi:hypothetical protein